MPSSSPALPEFLRRNDRWVLALAALLYLPFTLLGYGTDVDSYHVVEAGERIMAGLPYEQSREPGFLVHEVATGVLDWLGGSTLTNLGSVALALVVLGSFLALCRRLRVPHSALLGLTLAVHPLFWVSATTTMDYVWALGFGLAGGVLLWDRRWGWAGVLFGLAIGSRITSVLLIVALAGYVFWQRAEDRRGVAWSVGLGFGLGALCFVPTLVQYGGTLGFLVPVGAEEQAGWSWLERVGRFGYKNVYVWGLPATLVLVGALGFGASRVIRERIRNPVLGLAAAGVLLYEALYLRYPLEPEYLLPLVPFVLLGLGVLVGAPLAHRALRDGVALQRRLAQPRAAGPPEPRAVRRARRVGRAGAPRHRHATTAPRAGLSELRVLDRALGGRHVLGSGRRAVAMQA